MKLLTKKWVVYLLATLMVMPTWFLVSMASATPVLAAAASTEYTRYSSNVSTFMPSDWHIYNDELHTNGSVDNSYVKADDVLDASTDAVGEYRIEAQWLVWGNHTKSATYEILQGTDKKDIKNVDQTKNADGSSVADNTKSGYLVLDSDYYFSGVHDVDLKMLGENSDNGNNSFISFRVTFISGDTVPSAPVLTSPADGSIVNTKSPKFVWQPASDADGDSVTYELFVKKVSNGATIIHRSGLTDTFFQPTNPNKLPDNKYKWFVLADDGSKKSDSSLVNTFITDTIKPTAPVNLSATVSGGDVNLLWDATSTDSNGVAGYNIYRSGTAEPVNLTPVSGNAFTDKPGNGTFDYYVVAIDNAGNESASSNTVSASVAYYPAPSFTVSAGTGKSINVTFSNVQADATEYDVIINGKTYVIMAPTASTYNILVSDYGTYNVYAIAKYGAVTSVNSATETINLVAPVTPVVKTSSVKVSVVAPASAAAATTVPAASTGIDESGKIKAAEDTSSTDSNKINWTPWIILFILILLAGAATGGYFYWFGGENEGSAATVAIKDKKVIAPVKKAEAKKPVGKGDKKSRRW